MRYFGTLHWRWDLGLVHGTLHFTQASPKSHVNYILMASQGSKVGLGTSCESALRSKNAMNSGRLKMLGLQNAQL